MKKRSKTGRGFTLVELVVVIAIIAVLAAVSVAGYYGFTAKAKESADISLVKQLDTMVKAADEEDLVNAVELRKYFEENGIEKIETQNKKNLIVYDLNRKEVELVKASEGSQKKGRSRSIDGGVLTYVYTAAGSGLELNENPSAPEELFAGKMILSTKGNSLGEYLYRIRCGQVNSSIIEGIEKLDKSTDKSLARMVASALSKYLFIDAEGNSSSYKLSLGTGGSGYSVEPISYSDGDIASESLKYAIFEPECKVLTAATFPRGTSIDKLLVPSSVTTIDDTAFNVFIDDVEKVSNLNLSFVNTANVVGYDNLKTNLVANGVTLVKASALAESLRTDSDIYQSGIEQYIDVRTAEELQTILPSALAGDCIRIVADMTIATPLTVNSGVTLLVPAIDEDPGYNPSTGYNPNGTSTTRVDGDGKPKGDHIKKYVSVSLNSTLTIEKNGSVLVNAVTGMPAAGDFDQDVNGGYGEIIMSSDALITVKDGGLLDCCGYISGSGQVIGESGGTIRDLYVVRNWRGGSQAAAVFQDIYPMNEYDMKNISAPILIKSGGSLAGTVKMYAGEMFNYTRFPQIDNDNGLIRLAEGASLKRTIVDGREKYEIEGGAVFSQSTLNIVGLELSTRSYLYPIDGDIDFICRNGSYRYDEAYSAQSGIRGYKYLPGATLTIDTNATLTIPRDVQIVFYDKFEDVDNTSTTEYPSDRGPAQLILNSTAGMTVEGVLAGQVNFTDPVGSYTIRINDQVQSITTYEANGYYNTVSANQVLRRLSFSLNFVNSTHFYWSESDVLTGYAQNKWVSFAQAISDFKKLEIVNRRVDEVTDIDKAAVEEAYNLYQNLLISNLSEGEKQALRTDYEATLTAMKERVATKSVENITTGTRYSTLELALQEVTSGDTLTVLNDLYINGDITIGQGELTIYLNSKSLTFSDGSIITNEGTLSIQNGHIQTESSSGAVSINNNGALALTDVTNGPDSPATVGNLVICNDGTLKVASCSLYLNNNSFDLITNNRRIEEIRDSKLLVEGSVAWIVFDSMGSSGTGVLTGTTFQSADEGAVKFNENIELIENCRFTGESSIHSFNGDVNRVSESYFTGGTTSFAVISVSGLFAIDSIYIKPTISGGELIDGDYTVKDGFIISPTPLSSGANAGYFGVVEGFVILLKRGSLEYYDNGKQYRYVKGSVPDITLDFLLQDREYIYTPCGFLNKEYGDSTATAVDITEVHSNMTLYVDYTKTEQTAKYLLAVHNNGGTGQKFGFNRDTVTSFESFEPAFSELLSTDTVYNSLIIRDDSTVNLTVNWKFDYAGSRAKTFYIDLYGHNLTNVESLPIIESQSLISVNISDSLGTSTIESSCSVENYRMIFLDGGSQLTMCNIKMVYSGTSATSSMVYIKGKNSSVYLTSASLVSSSGNVVKIINTATGISKLSLVETSICGINPIDLDCSTGKVWLLGNNGRVKALVTSTTGMNIVSKDIYKFSITNLSLTLPTGVPAVTIAGNASMTWEAKEYSRIPNVEDASYEDINVTLQKKA